MSWDIIEWRPAENGLFDLAPTIGAMWPMIQSSLEEAVSAAIQGPATVGDMTVATIDAASLPPEFAAVASFELLGTARRGVWTAFDPSQGSILGGSPQSSTGLQAALLEALDSVVQAMVGEGLGLGPTDGLQPLSGELSLIRIPIRDATGAQVDSVIAVEAPVPGELAAHIVALQALNEPSSPVSEPPAAAAGPEPVLAAAARPATRAAAETAAEPVAPPIPVRPMSLPEFAPTPLPPNTHNIELLLGVNLEVSVEIGRAQMAIRDVLGLAPGSVIELDKLAGERVDVLVNGRPIASGEVVVVDENFGVRITEVVSRQHRILSADGRR